MLSRVASRNRFTIFDKDHLLKHVIIYITFERNFLP